MQFSTTIVVIALSAVASMAEFICAPDASTANFGGCCQLIDEHNGGENCTRATLSSTATVTNTNGTTSSIQRYLCADTDKPETTCCHFTNLYKVKGYERQYEVAIQSLC
ncbi:hypothetical protein N431DRAFT_441593 [Stipitochalara longipes BDJ]|nr:hypothetical protein N431DRAFT_441593 [Stipitochalara longipes BDJ]